MLRNLFEWMVILIFCVPIVSCNSKSKSSPGQVHRQVEQIVTYTCPMHPQIKKNQPGQCPICGMNLVKAETSQPEQESKPVTDIGTAPSGHARFTLSMDRSQMIGVKLGVVEKKPLFKSIRAAGRLAFDPELYTAQNEYIEAVKQIESVRDSPVADVKQSSQRMLDAAKLRLKILGLSDGQIARLAKGESNDARLLLNRTGDSVWVYAEIYEMDLPLVQPGLAAEISARFLGGETLPGKVVSIDRVLNAATRTAKARILVSNARSLLRPESYVDVTILAPLGEQVTVPFDAVFDTGKEAWVFVADGKGGLDPRLVQIKFHVGNEVALEKGVEEGDRIVTSANFLIDSESRLKGVMAAVPEKTSENPQAKTPSCPKDQHWDVGMKMCMPD